MAPRRGSFRLTFDVLRNELRNRNRPTIAKNVYQNLVQGGMGFQPMNHRQDAEATRRHGQDARATFQVRSKKGVTICKPIVS